MQLPATVQEIADVIGRDKALYLIGQLPKVYTPTASQKTRCVLYVPQRLNVTDNLVRILGWDDASKLVREFRGMLIQPANCADIIRRHQNANIARLRREGVSAKIIAEWFNVSDRHVRMVAAENPPQVKPQAANDNAPTVITQAHADNGSSSRAN